MEPTPGVLAATPVEPDAPTVALLLLAAAAASSALSLAALAAAWAAREVGDNWMDPEEVGEMVAAGILANSTYIVTHGIFKDWQRARSQAVLDATPDVAESATRGI